MDTCAQPISSRIRIPLIREVVIQILGAVVPPEFFSKFLGTKFDFLNLKTEMGALNAVYPPIRVKCEEPEEPPDAYRKKMDGVAGLEPAHTRIKT